MLSALSSSSFNLSVMWLTPSRHSPAGVQGAFSPARPVQSVQLLFLPEGCFLLKAPSGSLFCQGQCGNLTGLQVAFPGVSAHGWCTARGSVILGPPVCSAFSPVSQVPILVYPALTLVKTSWANFGANEALMGFGPDLDSSLSKIFTHTAA